MGGAINAEELQSHVEKCLDAANTQKHEKAKKFYENAIKILQKPKIPILKIIDENTTGLNGDRWDALVYKEGTPNKDEPTAGGSFGIGKNAPYAASDLSLVCYSTHYIDKHRIEKFIGRCKLMAHDDPNNSDEELQHVGFGTSNDRKGRYYPPIMGNEIQEEFRLDERGTGIFIFGFKGEQKWQKPARRSVVDNFFAAIHDRKLEVKIGDININNDTLNGEEFTCEKKYYYNLWRDSATPTIVEGKFGKFELRIASGDEDMENRVAYINSRGMFITAEKSCAKNPFHIRIEIGKFMAIIRAVDEKTEKRIREMEPPTHESIEYKRLKGNEQKRVKIELDEINDKIRGHVKKLLNLDDSRESTNLTELAEIIPFVSESDGKNGINDEEKVRQPRKIEVKTIQISNRIPVMGGEDGTGGDGPGPTDGEGGPNNHIKSKKRATKTSMQDAHVTRHVNNGGKLRVRFTSKTGTNKFIICPAGEEDKNEKAITFSKVEIIQNANTATCQKEFIIVNSEIGKRVILDLPIERSSQYTGYSVVEYRTRGERK